MPNDFKFDSNGPCYRGDDQVNKGFSSARDQQLDFAFEVLQLETAQILTSNVLTIFTSKYPALDDREERPSAAQDRRIEAPGNTDCKSERVSIAVFLCFR